MASAEAELSSGRFQQARSELAGLDAVYSGEEHPSPQQEEQRQALELKIAAARRAAQDRQCEEKLAAAEEAMNVGRFQEALRLANEIHAGNPSPAQQQRAGTLRVEIRRRQQRHRQWQPYLKMLASASRRNLQAAQAELRKDPDAALSLLAQIAEQSDEPQLVSGALETLATLDRPRHVLPLLVAVLRRDSQRESWQTAMRQIVQLQHRGAGEELLELSLADAPIDQRLAALETLSQVVDPPPQTLSALLPLIHRDGPLLRLALVAAAHAAETHRQWDPPLQAGGNTLSAATQDQWNQLPQRLAALSSPKRGTSDVALAAETLAVALRLIAPQPLGGVKVHTATAEMPGSPPAAAVDGIWNSTDVKTMWRHSGEPPASITLDLGQERTVAAVKLWNLNEPAAAAGGWKIAKIHAGSAETDLRQLTAGVIPLAPGAAEPADYGTVISIPCVRARYVRLELVSAWQAGGPSGLSEIQVLGF